ncbi:MAG: hypothetical protein JSV24_07870 [Bacteroidales bacterium]|nr:MAG: hypothetical protein JSV24_07870 [Bacteroidales bacterium]
MHTYEWEINLAFIESRNSDDRNKFRVRNRLQYPAYRKPETEKKESDNTYSWIFDEKGMIVFESDLPQEATGKYRKAIKE